MQRGVLTPEGVKAAERRQSMVEALMAQQIGQGGPVGSPLEGVAKVGTNIVLALLARKAGKNTDDAKATSYGAMADALMGRQQGMPTPLFPGADGRPPPNENDVKIEAMLRNPETAELGAQLYAKKLESQFAPEGETWTDTPTPEGATGLWQRNNRGQRKQVYDPPKPEGASSAIGRINDDLKAGRISPEMAQAMIRRETYIAPQQPRAPEPLQLVPVMTPDGPRYVPERQAIGMSPFRESMADGATTAALRTRKQKIDDAMRLSGVSEAEATALVDNYSNVRLDPVTGKPVSINEALNTAKPVEITRQTIPLVSGAPQAPTMGQVAGSTGLQGVATELASKTLGQFDKSFVNEANTSARTHLRSLQNRLVNALSLSSRPPVFEQKQISGMVPSEGILESPARAQQILENLKGMMIRQRNADAEYVNSGAASAKETAESQQRIYELDQLVREMDPGMAAGRSASPAPSGAAPNQRIRLDANGEIIP